MRRDVARDRDESDARRKTPKEWQELVELGRRYHRRLAHQHEELRRGAAMLSDDYSEFRDRINRVVLPSIQGDIDESKRLIRKAELFAEYSGRRAAKSRQTQ